MKSGSCGLVQRISTADCATPHPDPSGGQAPRLAKSSTALHFLIPPSTIGLQFGTFRRWRAGIEDDWRAHPGSESGTCFHSNRSSRLVPAHQGMKIGSCGLVQRDQRRMCQAPPRPQRGTSPSRNSTALHFLIPRPSDYNSGVSPVESRHRGIGGHIGAIESGWAHFRKRRGRIFVRMTTCGLRTIEMALAG